MISKTSITPSSYSYLDYHLAVIAVAEAGGRSLSRPIVKGRRSHVIIVAR